MCGCNRIAVGLATRSVSGTRHGKIGYHALLEVVIEFITIVIEILQAVSRRDLGRRTPAGMAVNAWHHSRQPPRAVTIERGRTGLQPENGWEPWSVVAVDIVDLEMTESGYAKAVVFICRSTREVVAGLIDLICRQKKR